jgi:hypothetical protein
MVGASVDADANANGPDVSADPGAGGVGRA